MTAVSTISTEELDHRFDEGEGLEEFIDMEHPAIHRANADEPRHVNSTKPARLIDALDADAKHQAPQGTPSWT